MKYPRVNLLKKGELRYQGAVSGRFIVVSAIAVPVLIVVLLIGIILIQNGRVKSALKKSRTQWAELKPQYDAYKNEARDLSVSRNMVEMFEGWQGTQVAFSKLLDEIQLAVPGNIQLSRLSVRGNSDSTSFLKPEDMRLAYTIVLEGQSFGASAEQHVFGLQRQLLDSGQIGATFESLEPEYIRKQDASSGEPVRQFKLAGSAAGGRL